MTASTYSHERSGTEVDTPRDNSVLDEKAAPGTTGDNINNTENNNDAPTDTAVYPSGTKLALIISSLCMAVFLVALDQTIIAPALGAITAEYKSVKDIVSLPPYVDQGSC